jgi:Oxysterol-binding protein.
MLFITMGFSVLIVSYYIPGYVNVKLLRPDSNDHYRWNKVTTCVHNLFGGQRWVDQYGELNITNLDTNITCKLTFLKVIISLLNFKVI